MYRKSIFIVLLVSCAIVLAYVVHTDIRLQRHYTYDLRNRVVGARLIKDGYSPYFYKWKKKDGIRYYDAQNIDGATVSVMTGSPFFHHLLYPIAEWPQSKISQWWLVIEYLFFSATVVLAWLLAGNDRQRYLVLLAAMLFLLTKAWIFHVLRGQYYIGIPFGAMVFYYLLQKSRNIPGSAAAGLTAIILVLIKPPVILFLLPFIWLVRSYSRGQLIAFFIPVVLLTGWTLADRQELFLWQDYLKSIPEQIKMHQVGNPVIQPHDPDPGYKEWEGIGDWRRVEDEDPLVPSNESGNFYLLVLRFFDRNVPLPVQKAVCFFLILGLAGSFYFAHRRGNTPDPEKIAILGFCLYMVSDLFSPITRFQYNTVQWLFPLLVAATIYEPRYKGIFGVLGAGLALNIIDLPKGPGHTLGEYLMLGALISLSFSRKPAKNAPFYP